MPLLLLGTASVKLSNVLWKTYLCLLPLNIHKCLIFSPKSLRQLVQLTVWKMCWENLDSLVWLRKALCHLGILSSLGNPPGVQFRGRWHCWSNAKAVQGVKEPGPIVKVRGMFKTNRVPSPLPPLQVLCLAPKQPYFSFGAFSFLICMLEKWSGPIIKRPFSKLDGPPWRKQEYLFHTGPLVLPLAPVLPKPCQVQYPVSSQRESQPEKQGDWSRDCVLSDYVRQKQPPQGQHAVVLPSIHTAIVTLSVWNACSAVWIQAGLLQM